MERNLYLLDRQEFDLIVVGGGIFGACAAWDATQRGLSVALIDRGDFCNATSANSFKLIHGGIRYLQHGDFGRVRMSANARRTLIRIAPHLAYPLPVVVPTYGHGMKGKEILRMAMGVYDVITYDRNQGIEDPERWISRGKCLSRLDVLDRYPGLPAKGLTGAAVFCDGQMYNPPRLVLAFIRTAAEEGAVMANYVEATRFLSKKNQVCGVQVQDVLSGEQFTIRGKVVLNTAGPYAEGLLQDSLGKSLEPKTPWSRDAYFVVARPLVTGKEALAIPATTKDPDAFLSRGNRHLFLVPWHDSTLVGVWHKAYTGHPDEYTVTDEELGTFIDEVNGSYANLELTLDDVALWNAGLIQFGENNSEGKDLKFAHHSRLVDHEKERGLQGLITLIGVRYTTGPSDAVRVVNLIFDKLGKVSPPSRSHETALFGGEIPNFEALVERAKADWPSSNSSEAIGALVHNHGTAYSRVLFYAKERLELGVPFEGSTVFKAEVIHAVREEMAQNLSDVVFRRTDLGTARLPQSSILQEVGEILGVELGWDECRRQSEIERVLQAFPQNHSADPVCNVDS